MPDEVIFRWVQSVSSEAECELRLNDTEVVALFRCDENGPEVETAYTRWSFKQVGIIRTAIMVKNIQTGQIEAAYRAAFRGGGGTVQLKQGNTRFNWQATGPKVLDWLDGENNLWGQFRLESNKTGKQGQLVTTQEWVERDEFEILMALGWYLSMMQLGYKGSISSQPPDGVITY